MMKYLLMFLPLFFLSWIPATAQNGTMSSPFIIPVNNCGNGIFTDYQNTGNFSNTYGNSSPDIWYSFTLSETAYVNISFCGSGFDTYMHLLDQNTNLVASNDDNGPLCNGNNSSMIQHLTAGTYYLVAEGYSSYSGTLSLNFNLSGSGSVVNGANLGNAIEVGTFSNSGNYTDTRSNDDDCMGNDIGQPSNDIYYRFTLTGSADVKLSHCGTLFDTFMHLLDAYGNEITHNDDSWSSPCPGSQAYIETSLPAGTYYVVSEGYSTYSGNIITSINVQMPGSSVAPFITYATPAVLPLGLPVNLIPTNSGGAVRSSEQSTITLAGSGNPGFSDGFGADATFNYVINTAVDAAGNVYVADAGNHSIRKITPGGQVTTFAGRGYAGYADGTGTAAAFQRPAGFAIDASGNLFVSDQNNHRIRKITPAGIVTTFAGSGVAGSADGVGTSASFNNPIGLTFDASGNLFVADYTMHKIRKITPGGVVSTFAGTGAQGSINGPALSATFNNPMGVVFDAAGNLFVADRYNFQVRKITPAGIVSTFAGNGVAGYQDGTGPGAQFRHVNSMVLDKSGNIYINDQTNNMIRKITPAGVVSTFAGTTTPDVVNGTGSVVRLSSPYGLSIDNNENIYIAEDNTNRIRKMTILRAYTISPALPAGLLFNNTDGTITGTPTAASPLTTYTVTAYNGSGSSSTTLSFAVTAGGVCLTPSQDQNYVISYMPREAGMTTAEAVLAASCNANMVQTSIQYVDGLGRPLQTVQVKGSAQADKDVVVPIAYDEFERERFKYLPYAATTANGTYKADALTSVIGYYAGQPAGQSQPFNTPFSETRFEASPLNRVLEQGAPGAAWQIGANNTGNTLKTEYGTNIANDIKLWRVVPGGANGTETYAVGRLYKITNKDENWKLVDGKAGTADVYKDLEGRVILKRVWETDSKNLATYYVYDDFGNLTYVLPPAVNEGTDRLTGALNSFIEEDIEFKNFIYGYHYDGRKRLVEKKAPGKDWELMVYNSLDQVILSQDWKQRIDGKWLLTKYDAFERVILTGLYSDGRTRPEIQAEVNNLTVNNPNYQWWEEKTGSGVGYTNKVFPQSISNYHSLNYYDDYDFPGNVFGQPNSGLGQMQPSRTKGLLTGSSVLVLGTSNSMLLTVNYYDAEGRVIQSKGQHYKRSTADQYNYDEVSNVYSFTGELKERTRRHFNNNSEALYIYNKYQYDHMGRRVSTEQKTANNLSDASELPLVQLSGSEYNEIGQLLNKGQHRIGANLFLENTAYSYNERGWLKTSNSGLFNMELKYQDTADPLYRQYNGNIAQQIYTNGSGNTFTYAYDKLNRLSVSSAGNGLGESITYDVMGNIKTLSRDGFGINDYNISQYAGNQLKHISGFTNGTYTYNENGNLTVDGPNGNTISYNYLNLPMQVTGNQNVIYTYDAEGKKLRKQNVLTGTTDYIDGIQYKSNGTIDFVQTEDGITRNNGGVYSYEYNQTDHLGNVRLSFYRNPSTGSLEVLQRDDYYAFGQKKNVKPGVNKYLYSGKELQEELGAAGIGQLDYGARFYDPVIGRWNVIDPLTDMSQTTSPYVFCVNNPILFTDKLGMDTLRVHNLAPVTITGIGRGYEGLLMFTNPVGLSKMALGKALDFFNVPSNSPNLFTLLLNSNLNRSKSDITGKMLEKLKKDPGMAKFKINLIKALKAQPGMKKIRFKESVEFGGTWENGSKVKITMNNLTWAIRHAEVTADAVVKSDGTIVVQFSTSDVLDLTPQENRSFNYNTASFLLGTAYHGIGGGSMDMETQASWSEIIKP